WPSQRWSWGRAPVSRRATISTAPSRWRALPSCSRPRDTAPGFRRARARLGRALAGEPSRWRGTSRKAGSPHRAARAVDVGPRSVACRQTSVRHETENPGDPPVHSSFLSLLALAWALLIAPAALAQSTRDTSANQQIDEAADMHYLATDFDKAEGVLLGTVKACEDKCSPQTLARAWMYVGIVRGSGRSDIPGAKEAFQSAVALDPDVRLDAALATAETQTAFNEVAGSGPVTPAAPPPAQVPAEPEDVAAVPSGEGLFCTPDVPEIETRRPIPVECRTDEEATSMELRYQSFGSDT